MWKALPWCVPLLRWCPDQFPLRHFALEACGIRLGVSSAFHAWRFRQVLALPLLSSCISGCSCGFEGLCYSSVPVCMRSVSAVLLDHPIMSLSTSVVLDFLSRVCHARGRAARTVSTYVSALADPLRFGFGLVLDGRLLGPDAKRFLPSSTSSYTFPSVLVTTQGSAHSEGYDVIASCNSTGSAGEDVVPGCIGFRSPFFPAPGFSTAPVLDLLLCY